QRIGLFNEKLARIQDMEFKRRLARSGCKILLVPGAFADYQARSDLRSFWLHNWSDGVWTVLAFAWLFAVVVGVYLIAALTVSTRIAIAEKNPAYLVAVPAVIATMHLARGIGSLWGVVVLFSRRRFGHAVRLALREVWS